MRLFRDQCVGNAWFVASGSARILIVRPQIIFPSIPAVSELSASGTGRNAYSIESQLHRVAMPPTQTTASAQPTDRAEERLRIQRWDQARERRYQTICALRVLMEVHDRSNWLLASLPTRSAPLLQGDDMGIIGRLMLRAEDVPPLVTDEDESLTDWDAEGEVDMGED